MKTPDEIKRGLECCHDAETCVCSCCPYSLAGTETLGCDFLLGEDALAYIQQLERDNEQKDERIKQYEQDTNGFWFVPGIGKLPVRLNCSFRWISVEERLPEKQRRVIVCNGHGVVTVGWRSYHRDKAGNELWVIGDEPHKANDIVLWMPLPEPPEEGEE